MLTLLLSLWFSQPTIEIPLESHKMTLDESISFYADKYHVSSLVMKQLVFCESSNDPNAENISSVEESYGLAQINLKAHNITKGQATSPNFALDFMAKNIAKGRVDTMWVNCWDKINK